MTTAKKIELSRREKSFSQDDLARHVGVSRATIIRYESGGAKRYDATLLEKIAKVTGKPLSFFIEEEEPKIKYDLSIIPIESSAQANANNDPDQFVLEFPKSGKTEYVDISGAKPIKIEGDSMAPTVWSGQKVFYKEGEVLKDGDMVYVQLKSGVRCFKRYYAGRKNNIIFESINSKHKIMDLERSDVKFMHKIVGSWYV